ncbi:MAG TPA: MnhB domain-containing protein [Solirubrobacteraceae bacterium]|jgi:multicomponent Na+:H+ antiporter subunit B|nr:MnhB domain-containing protein [Solirubrobacteraceae bacterium]
MSTAVRRAVVLAGLAAVAALCLWGLAEVPGFGHYRGPYGKVINRITVPERRVTNAVSAVNFDFRAFDTVGEELILFVAVTGVVLLLRGQRADLPDPDDAGERGGDAPWTSDALRVAGLGAVAVVLLVGLYIVSHGNLTPGGGFQGGVLLACAVLLLYLAGELISERRLRPSSAMEAVHTAGAAGFVALGVGGLIAGAELMTNFIDLGTANKLLSGGTIPLGNVAVGVEVTGGFVLLFAEFIEQAVRLGVARE